MAFSKKTKMFYVPSNEWGMDIWNEPITYKKGAAYLGAGFTIKPNYEDHIGSLKAIDPDTGEVKWEFKNDAPLWGGVMTTAGGLVFTGTPEGEIKAFDDETGRAHLLLRNGEIRIDARRADLEDLVEVGTPQADPELRPRTSRSSRFCSWFAVRDKLKGACARLLHFR